MKLKSLVGKLHPLERKVLPVLAGEKSFSRIVERSGLQEIEVMRALQWLENKKALKILKGKKKVVKLDKQGKKYVREGLPERKFLSVLSDKFLGLKEAAKKSGLSGEELNACLGLLKGKLAIEIKKEKELMVRLGGQGKRFLEEGTPEEKFLGKKWPVDFDTVKELDKLALDNLLKRKGFLKVEEVKEVSVALSDLGKQLVKSDLGQEMIGRLTPGMLKDGSWKGKKFRAYDVEINVPKIYGGKKQHYRAFLDEVREKFLSLGFEEMSGPMVESEFWNMDALFMPQFHSARDIHDAYYIKEPKQAKLEGRLVGKVKEAHERGIGGSKGWQYKFDEEKTKQLILRTQGTACSARKLASKELKIPGKYFGITRCFRPDVADASHLPDFNQVEGIVVEEGLDLRHLVGLLKMFAREFAGAKEVKVVPGYFPFTEPSCELFAKHKEMGWIELGGAGIFRPELVKPLVGKEVPVLAWGIGVDRLGMFKLGLKDIRDLFSHDLGLLRRMKAI